MNVSGKRISVIGAVRSGVGAAKLVKKLGGVPFVSDTAAESKIKNSVSLLKENEIEL